MADRKKPQPVELFREKQSPLLWALPPRVQAGETAELIKKLHRLACKPPAKGKPALDDAVNSATAAELKAWLAQSDGADGDAALALECLAWAHALPALASRVPAAAWWELLARLLDCVDDAVSLDDALAR